MVTEEIVDFVGQCEKIVDVPVLLRSLDAELGDRVLQVLEQIVEVLQLDVPQNSVHRPSGGYFSRPTVLTVHKTRDSMVQCWDGRRHAPWCANDSAMVQTAQKTVASACAVL